MDGINSINTGGGALEFAPGYILLPTGGLWAYVHASIGSLDRLPPGMASAPLGSFTTVAAAAAACRSGRGDRIVCLPGHTESVSSANYLSNLGTKTDVSIVGTGTGTNRPTFTWTIAGSTLMTTTPANFGIDNCILSLEPGSGTVSVAAPITITGAGNFIRRCRIYAGTDATNLCTIPLTVLGTDFQFEDNYSTSGVLALSTCYMRLTAADRAIIRRNYISHAAGVSATVGVLSYLTTLSANNLVQANYIQNCTASSKVAISSGSVVNTGTLADNRLRVGLDSETGYIVTTSAAWQLFENYGVNNLGETGQLCGVASA